jgi:hypothetical protein
MRINNKPFTSEEVADAINDNAPSLAKAAKQLDKTGRCSERVTVGLLRRWVADLDQPEVEEEVNRGRELVRIRNAQINTSKLRKDVKALTDIVRSQDDMQIMIEQTVAALGERAPHHFDVSPKGATGLTVEVLLSDLQIGKLTSEYNTKVAQRRLFEMGRAVVFQIKQKIAAGYNIDRIVLGILGDIIESDKKHKNSARACDTGTAEQMHNAMLGMFEFVVEPLAALGFPMHVVCITGNHDWDDHGLNMYKPGSEQLSWPLYNALKEITIRSGYTNCTFDIPTGSYSTVDFYGQKAIYEHGVGVSNTEASMKAHKIKRAEQGREHITYFRMGDKHTVTTFNGGQMVVNGAFFGSGAGGGEYSEIAGYSSVPAQWMAFHTARDDNRLTLYDQFVIQLDHIQE